jgi:FAD/FMN-containing dehydrogenase
MTFQDTFSPEGCNFTLPTTSVPVSAGHTMVEIYTAADAQNQTIVGGAAEGVGIGGYVTGAGHSPLSIAHGLAADNILQVTLVTPSGDVLTANECQNSDLFYAFRGGRGSTFGVLLSATLKTYPSPAMTVFELQMVFLKSSEAFWDIMTYLLSQYPYLSSQGISGYPYMAPFYPLSATLTGALYSANFADPTSAFGESILRRYLSRYWNIFRRHGQEQFTR